MSLPHLHDCPKAYTADQDKALSPADTVVRVKALLAGKGQGILAATRRIDTGRLGIPVFMSMYGPRASQVAPTRKQMGKGASPEQAEASALMELVERYSFFSFFADPEALEELTWSEAEAHHGAKLLPLSTMLASVDERLPEEQARRVLDLVTLRFCPALRLADQAEVVVPADWFKLLNEYNGSSAGNTFEESILQGVCELVERHVCARIDREHPTLPTIDPASADDPVLRDLLQAFQRAGVRVVLKDFSLGFPVATVGALAWDPATFPQASEIVFTAGTATSPAKAAIRALTEVAQLAGDFETKACYEPSGLPKPRSLEDTAWLQAGPHVTLASLPSLEQDNILTELTHLAQGLRAMGFEAYSLSTSQPELGVPTNYNLVPGFAFRERSRHASLGLFVGRRLAEEEEPEAASRGLKTLGEIYGQAHFLPFFEGLLALRVQDTTVAALKFEKALPLQPDDEDRALCAFYAAYALSQEERWDGALPHLDTALALQSEVKEYFNLRGVCHFKQANFAAAAEDFRAAVELDKGSAMDLANLGMCLKALGQREEAIDCLVTALELEPRLEFAKQHLAELLEEFPEA